MKKIALYIILSGILISLQSCTTKSNGQWKSQKTNLENKLLVRDKIEFKEAEYNRLIFSMKTKFGKMIHTVYTHRNSTKVIGIQFSYPEGLIENPSKDLPYKIERILVDLKL